jgi:hypothetical protein
MISSQVLKNWATGPRICAAAHISLATLWQVSLLDMKFGCFIFEQ